MDLPNANETRPLADAEISLPPTKELVQSLLKVTTKVSDIFFSPMRLPEVRANGRTIPAHLPGIPLLLPDDTRRIASDLIGHRRNISLRLDAEGSCDFSIFYTPLGRFRVNILSQRGSYAITLRVVSDPVLPTFRSLRLPAQFERLVHLRSGLVVVNGPTGSGKSSTLAAIVNQINEHREVHIVTVEDPIEFQFRHQKATILQRELYRDVPTFPLALRAALRHPPHVILLGEIPDRDTLDLALEAADCGHLVFAAINTPDASRTVARLLRFFSPLEEQATRARLARSLRAIVSQRLLPQKDNRGQIAMFEFLFSTPRIRECIAHGEERVISLTDAIRQGEREGMQSFESEFEKLQQAGVLATDVTWDDLFGDRIPPHDGPSNGHDPLRSFATSHSELTESPSR
jgi:twitching motility protein PilT